METVVLHKSKWERVHHLEGPEGSLHSLLTFTNSNSTSCAPDMWVLGNFGPSPDEAIQWPVASKEMIMSEERALSLQSPGRCSVSPRIFIRFRPLVSKDAHQAHVGRPGHPQKAVKACHRCNKEYCTSGGPDHFADNSDEFLEGFRIAIVPFGPWRITQRQTPPAQTERVLTVPPAEKWGFIPLTDVAGSTPMLIDPLVVVVNGWAAFAFALKPVSEAPRVSWMARSIRCRPPGIADHIWSVRGTLGRGLTALS